MRKEEEEIMTNVVTNIKDLVETEDIENKYSNPKLDIILDFLWLKSIAKASKKEIAKYTEKNKNIRNGQRVIKGTRITTKELLMIMTERDAQENVVEYITKQYPSIDCDEKILYGALCEIEKTNTFTFALKIWLGK